MSVVDEERWSVTTSKRTALRIQAEEGGSGSESSEERSLRSTLSSLSRAWRIQPIEKAVFLGEDLNEVDYSSGSTLTSLSVGGRCLTIERAVRATRAGFRRSN